MGESDVKVARIPKYRATAEPNHTFTFAPNFLDHDSSGDGPHHNWADSIFYIWTIEDWLYGTKGETKLGSFLVFLVH